MKKIILSFLLAAAILPAFAQKGITFKVEELSKPEKPLYMRHSDEVYENLIMSDADLSRRDIERDSVNVPFNIFVKSDMPDSLVTYGYHSFFDGMYAAYAGHRPFILSPDMIWLLISQGFARHVNANPEAMRHLFVDFADKMSLVVTSDKVSLSSSADEWATIFPLFTAQLSENVKGDLVDVLTADFSTTTSIERVASQITIMEAMKSYFEFVHIYLACGIPEITLEGKPSDWQKVLDKTRQLAKYDLEWWTSELEPLLEEFVRASKGKVDKSFWRNMFKYHSEKKYGAPKIIDGWIVRFFPYDKEGRRNNLREITTKDKLPEEIVKVDLKYIELDETGASTERPLELWAGFIGLEQDKETYALTPKIGWMIREKDVDDTALRQKFESQSDGEIRIRVKEVPSALFEIPHIRYLIISFIGHISIPEQLKAVKIDHFNMFGEISSEEIERIKGMFPETGLTINGKLVQQATRREIIDPPIMVYDASYKALADSLIGASLPPDYAKAIRYLRTENRIHIINKKETEIVQVLYDFVNKDGQSYSYISDDKKYVSSSSTGFNLAFDTSHNLLTPISVELLQGVYDKYVVRLISNHEALSIAIKETGNENFKESPRLYYRTDTGSIVWRVRANRYKSGEALWVDVNAETGEITEIHY